MIDPSTTQFLPNAFRDVMPYSEAILPTTYTEFLTSYMQEEAERKFNSTVATLKRDVYQYDMMLDAFMSQIGIIGYIDPRQDMYGNRRGRNSLLGLVPDRRSVSSQSISDCFSKYSQSAQQVKNKQMDIVKAILSHPNDFLKSDTGVYSPATNTVCNALKTISAFAVASELNNTASRNNTGLTTNSKDIFSMMTSNNNGLIGGNNLPTSGSLYGSSSTMYGNNNNILSDMFSAQVICSNSIVSKALDVLVHDVKSVTNALGITIPQKLPTSNGKSLIDLAMSLQQTAGNAFSGIEQMLSTLGSSPEFKPIADALSATVAEVKAIIQAASNEASSILSQGSSFAGDIGTALSSLASGVSSMVGSLLENTISGLSSLKTDMLLSLDLKIDFLDLPLPTMAMLTGLVKEDVKFLNAEALTSDEQQIFGMILEIEHFAKTHSIAQRCYAISSARSCIKSQMPAAILENIAFTNNIGLTYNNEIDFYGAQARTGRVVPARTLANLRTAYRYYKSGLTKALPEDEYYRQVARGVI